MARQRSQRRWVGFALAAATVLAGCGSEGDAASAPDPVDDARATTTTVESTPTTEPAGSLPPGAEDLVGRWAHFDVVAYEDEVMQSLIISTGFADLELRDGELWNTQRFCHADMANNQGIETTFSDAATRAIVPVDTPVELTLEDGRLRVVRPATPTPIGIALENPAEESLPTDPADPRIVDADGDGNPGVTARIRISDELQGELYLARREIFHYDVTQESPDRLVGTITDDSEQLVLGASHEIFLTPAQWVQHRDPARNPVIWVRVDDSWDCDRLAAERDGLFPPNPEADW